MIGRINKNSLIFFFIIGLVYPFISYSLLENYTQGDQLHYHSFYNQIKDIPFSDVAPIARGTLSSVEPVSWFVLWLGSNLGVDKNIWISFLNIFLIYGIYLLLRKHDASRVVIMLILTNFYLLVLLTAAERLKIAYIFLTWAFVFEGRMRFIFAALSPLAHLQSLILFSSFLSSLIGKEILKILHLGKLSKRKILFIMLLLIVTGIIFLNAQEMIVLKLNSYNKFIKGLSDFLNIGILLIIGLFVTREKLQFVFAIIPIALAVYILGGDRVNMIAVTLLFGLLMYERRLSHPLFLLLLSYFSIKSVFFVEKIYLYGTGFI